MQIVYFIANRLFATQYIYRLSHNHIFNKAHIPNSYFTFTKRCERVGRRFPLLLF